MLLIYPSHPIREESTVHVVDGLSLVFRPLRLEGAIALVMASELDAAQAAAFAPHARTYSGLFREVEVVAPAPAVVVVQEPVQPAPMASALPARPTVQASLLARGWRVEDLEGLPLEGDLSPEAGRSVTTGLGAFEMIASVPPVGWDVLSAHHYPWEVSGWQPPSDEWRAPSVPAKPPAVTEPVTVVVPVAEPVVTDEADTQDAGGPREGLAQVGADHPLVGVYGTVEQVNAVRALMWQLGAPDAKIAFKKMEAILKANELPALKPGQLTMFFTT